MKLNKLLLYTLIVFLTNVLNAQTIPCSAREYFFFDHDKADINPVSKVEDKLLPILEGEIVSIRIIGHTDSTGSIGYNKLLSKRRTDFISRMIPEKFQDVVKCSFYGEEKPNTKTILSDYNSNNRRVLIVVEYNCEQNVEKSIEDQKVRSIVDKSDLTIVDEQLMEEKEQILYQNKEDSLQLSAFVSSYLPDTNVRSFDPTQSKAILTEKNTLILVQEETFVRKDGTMPVEVNLAIQEFYDVKSIMAGKLNTKTTSGEWLESGGMLYIEATDENGEELALQKPITIGVPREDSIGFKPGMQLYNGIETQNGIKWNLNNVPTYQKPSKIDLKRLAIEAGKDLGKMALDSLSEINRGARIGVKVFRFFANGNKNLKGQDKRIYVKGVENGEINAEKAEEKKKYLFNVTQMGYVNCDRTALKGFSGRDITVRLKKIDIGKGSELVYLIFPTINSLTAPDSYDRFSMFDTFQKIPEGMPIVLISLKVINGEMFFAKEEVKASEEPVVPSYRKISDGEFEQEVKSLLNF